MRYNYFAAIKDIHFFMEGGDTIRNNSYKIMVRCPLDTFCLYPLKLEYNNSVLQYINGCDHSCNSTVCLKCSAALTGIFKNENEARAAVNLSEVRPDISMM